MKTTLNIDDQIMLLGPTAPLTPALFNFGIDLLSDVQVTDAESLFASVAQGSIFGNMVGLQRVTLKR